MSVRVALDRARCEGHGVCEEMAPQVYRLDEAGELEFPLDGVPLPGDVQAAAVAGAAACPVAALRVMREEG
ncbi:ferredoxin [Microbacterium sp. 18062]|uniref:ferredoxin n=1 Tax=Microbacterium sp. 18062 TaxID=2681410 RepID=UPI001F365403|nr:ferredoxin [Microbacterium sp. 18062]